MSCILGKLWLLCLVVLVQSHIYASPAQITYNYDGYPQHYSLFFSL